MMEKTGVTQKVSTKNLTTSSWGNDAVTIYKQINPARMRLAVFLAVTRNLDEFNFAGDVRFFEKRGSIINIMVKPAGCEDAGSRGQVYTGFFKRLLCALPIMV